MVARIAKTLGGDRRRFMPMRPAPSAIGEHDVAETAAMLIASLHSPDGENNLTSVRNELDHLYAALETVTPESHPRTARLLRSSNRKVAQKVIEEAGEVALAAVKHNDRGVVRESAELLYHLTVLWRRAGIDSADIWAEMRHRAASLGIAEKLPKSRAG